MSYQIPPNVLLAITTFFLGLSIHQVFSFTRHLNKRINAIWEYLASLEERLNNKK